MKIKEVALTVARLDEAGLFYRDVLGLPVVERPGQVTVTVGSSRLVLTRDAPFTGAHHLAFGIAPAEFEAARRWLGQRVDLLAVDGAEVVQGPRGWNSRSAHFLGPEEIVLELIARDADAGSRAGEGQIPGLLALSEVGIGVPDVASAVRELTGDLNVPTFPPHGPRFAPVGGHDGLIILVERDRIWFPTELQRAAQGPVTVTVVASRAGRLSLGHAATVLAVI